MISTTNFINARGPVCYWVEKATERIHFAINVFLNPFRLRN